MNPGMNTGMNTAPVAETQDTRDRGSHSSSTTKVPRAPNSSLCDLLAHAVQGHRLVLLCRSAGADLLVGNVA
jgi:hypothetical protein